LHETNEHKADTARDKKSEGGRDQDNDAGKEQAASRETATKVKERSWMELEMDKEVASGEIRLMKKQHGQ
jgi:hypothetical protein